MAEKRTEDTSGDSSEEASISNHELDSDFVEGPEWKRNDDRNCVLSLLVKYKKGQGKKIVKAVKSIACSWNFIAYWNFYTKCKPGQTMLHDIAKKYGCCVTVCTDDEDFFVFEATDTSFEQESDFLNFMDDVLDNIYKYAKQSLCCDVLRVDHRVQEDTLKSVKENEELHSAWIGLGEHDPDAVYVVCAVKDKMSVFDVLTSIISKVKECYNNHEETVVVDFIWQRVLKRFGYLQGYNNKFPKVMIEHDEETDAVVLKGPRHESKAAADHLLEVYGTARGEIHEKVFSPVCQFETFTYPEMCDYIDKSIPKLPVVWIPNNMTKKIHIFSKQPEHAKGVDKFIKGCVQERLYPLSKDLSSFPPKVVQIEELKKKHKGKVVIHAIDAGLLVTTADDIFETVDAELQEIIGSKRGSQLSEDTYQLQGKDAALACHFFEEKLIKIGSDCDCQIVRLPAIGIADMVTVKCLKPYMKKKFEGLFQNMKLEIQSFSSQELQFSEGQSGTVKRFIIENTSKDVLLYYNPKDNPAVLIYSKNSTTISNIYHKLKVELGIIKLTGRRGRELSTESEGNMFGTGNFGGRSVHDTPSGGIYPDLSSVTEYSDTDFDFRLGGNLLVKVYKGSITRVKVDAIVNTANESLHHAGGVARVIEDAAGKELTDESRNHIRKYGNLKVGDVCLTTAGKMQYRSVIHAVGPQWQMYSDKSKCLRDLYATICAVLLKADKEKYEKIAMPAISAGIFGVPKELCTDMYVRAAVIYSEDRKTHQTFLREFHIVDEDTEILQDIRASWEKWQRDPQAIDPERAADEYAKKHGSFHLSQLLKRRL